ncbi:unnamed protein product, partial [Allacma fusca]
MDPRTRMLLE